MRRRSFIKSVGLTTVGASGLSAPALAQSEPQVTWRCTSSFPKTLDTIFGAAQVMADRVEAATDGKFRIEVAEAGVFADALEAKNAVTTGTVEMAHSAAYYFWQEDEVYALAAAIPFGLNAVMGNAWLSKAGGAELLNDFFSDNGLHAIACGNTGSQLGGWFRKEINSLDDLSGIKMRIGGMGGQIIEKIGVVPTQVAVTEIADALANGELDAAEWVGPYDDEKLGFDKVATHCYYPGWWEGGAILHAMIGLEAWQSLPSHFQAVLQDACAYAHSDMQASYEMKNAAALQRLISGGIVFRPYSSDILNAAYEAALETYADISTRNQLFSDIYEHQTAFKRDAYQWVQFSEYAYDTYMTILQRSGRL